MIVVEECYGLSKQNKNSLNWKKCILTNNTWILLPAATPDTNNLYDKCDYGRLLTRSCVGLTPDPAGTYCPAGYVFYVPTDGEGPCCRR